MSDGSKFCTKCGAAVSETGFVNSLGQETTQPSESEFVQPTAAAATYLMQYVTGKGIHVLKDRTVSDSSGNVLFMIHRKSN
jgi:hypothetical protein